MTEFDTWMKSQAAKGEKKPRDNLRLVTYGCILTQGLIATRLLMNPDEISKGVGIGILVFLIVLIVIYEKR